MFRITQQLKVWATFFVSNYKEGEESKKGRMADALAQLPREFNKQVQIYLISS